MGSRWLAGQEKYPESDVYDAREGKAAARVGSRVRGRVLGSTHPHESSVQGARESERQVRGVDASAMSVIVGVDGVWGRREDVS